MPSYRIISKIQNSLLIPFLSGLQLVVKNFMTTFSVSGIPSDEGNEKGKKFSIFH